METPHGNLVAGMKWWLGEEPDVAQAERVVREERKARRWSESELARRTEGHLDEVKIAARSRKATRVKAKWTEARIGMGRRIR